MAVKTKYYIGPPGGISIYDAELSNTIIYRVTRSSFFYNKVSSNPSSLQFTYDPALGKVSFDVNNPFVHLYEVTPSIPQNLEIVSVKFRA